MLPHSVNQQLMERGSLSHQLCYYLSCEPISYLGEVGEQQNLNAIFSKLQNFRKLLHYWVN
jgi:hypothetical protein